MNKWFIETSFGFVGCYRFFGCYRQEVVEASTEEEAEDAARVIAIETAESYGFHQDEDYFGGLNKVGKDFDEGENKYYQEGFLDYYVEPYVPEKHDCQL